MRTAYLHCMRNYRAGEYAMRRCIKGSRVQLQHPIEVGIINGYLKINKRGRKVSPALTLFSMSGRGRVRFPIFWFHVPLAQPNPKLQVFNSHSHVGVPFQNVPHRLN